MNYLETPEYARRYEETLALSQRLTGNKEINMPKPIRPQVIVPPKSMIQPMQPYQYNVPSLTQMFPSLQGSMGMQNPMQAPMQNNPFQGGFGAGRFMGGLLGSMPTPVSTTTTQAPSSSGAGRFL
jgi:hypothetical protein